MINKSMPVKSIIEKNAKIYIAGHSGMVGSALIRLLKEKGCCNIITKTHSELDLCRQTQVEAFFQAEKPLQKAAVSWHLLHLSKTGAAANDRRLHAHV